MSLSWLKNLLPGASGPEGGTHVRVRLDLLEAQLHAGTPQGFRELRVKLYHDTSGGVKTFEGPAAVILPSAPAADGALNQGGSCKWAPPDDHIIFLSRLKPQGNTWQTRKFRLQLQLRRAASGPDAATGVWSEYGKMIEVDLSQHAPPTPTTTTPRTSVSGGSATPGRQSSRLSAPGTPGATPGALTVGSVGGMGEMAGGGPRMSREVTLDWNTQGFAGRMSRITVKARITCELLPPGSQHLRRVASSRHGTPVTVPRPPRSSAPGVTGPQTPAQEQEDEYDPWEAWSVASSGSSMSTGRNTRSHTASLPGIPLGSDHRAVRQPPPGPQPAGAGSLSVHGGPAIPVSALLAGGTAVPHTTSLSEGNLQSHNKQHTGTMAALPPGNPMPPSTPMPSQSAVEGSGHAPTCGSPPQSPSMPGLELGSVTSTPHSAQSCATRVSTVAVSPHMPPLELADSSAASTPMSVPTQPRSAVMGVDSPTGVEAAMSGGAPRSIVTLGGGLEARPAAHGTAAAGPGTGAGSTQAATGTSGQSELSALLDTFTTMPALEVANSITSTALMGTASFADMDAAVAAGAHAEGGTAGTASAVHGGHGAAGVAGDQPMLHGGAAAHGSHAVAMPSRVLPAGAPYGGGMVGPTLDADTRMQAAATRILGHHARMQAAMAGAQQQRGGKAGALHDMKEAGGPLVASEGGDGGDALAAPPAALPTAPAWALAAATGALGVALDAENTAAQQGLPSVAASPHAATAPAQHHPVAAPSGAEIASPLFVVPTTAIDPELIRTGSGAPDELPGSHGALSTAGSIAGVGEGLVRASPLGSRTGTGGLMTGLDSEVEGASNNTSLIFITPDTPLVGTLDAPHGELRSDHIQPLAVFPAVAAAAAAAAHEASVGAKSLEPGPGSVGAGGGEGAGTSRGGVAAAAPGSGGGDGSNQLLPQIVSGAERFAAMFPLMPLVAVGSVGAGVGTAGPDSLCHWLPGTGWGGEELSMATLGGGSGGGGVMALQQVEEGEEGDGSVSGWDMSTASLRQDALGRMGSGSTVGTGTAGSQGLPEQLRTADADTAHCGHGSLASGPAPAPARVLQHMGAPAAPGEEGVIVLAEPVRSTPSPTHRLHRSGSSRTAARTRSGGALPEAPSPTANRPRSPTTASSSVGRHTQRSVNGPGRRHSSPTSGAGTVATPTASPVAPFHPPEMHQAKRPALDPHLHGLALPLPGSLFTRHASGGLGVIGSSGTPGSAGSMGRAPSGALVADVEEGVLPLGLGWVGREMGGPDDDAARTPTHTSGRTGSAKALPHPHRHLSHQADSEAAGLMAGLGLAGLMESALSAGEELPHKKQPAEMTPEAGGVAAATGCWMTGGSHSAPLFVRRKVSGAHTGRGPPGPTADMDGTAILRGAPGDGSGSEGCGDLGRGVTAGGLRLRGLGHAGHADTGGGQEEAAEGVPREVEDALEAVPTLTGLSLAGPVTMGRGGDWGGGTCVPVLAFPAAGCAAKGSGVAVAGAVGGVGGSGGGVESGGGVVDDMRGRDAQEPASAGVRHHATSSLLPHVYGSGWTLADAVVRGLAARMATAARMASAHSSATATHAPSVHAHATDGLTVLLRWGLVGGAAWCAALDTAAWWVLGAGSSGRGTAVRKRKLKL